MDRLEQLLLELYARIPEEVWSAGAWAREAFEPLLQNGSAIFTIIVLLAAVLGLRSAYRLIVGAAEQRRIDAEAERLKLRVEAAKAEAASRQETRSHQAAEEFLKSLRAAVERGDVADGDLPLDWLEEVNPVLSEAYKLLAQNALASAKGPEDLKRGRRWAWGAAAAGSDTAAGLIDALKEAEDLKVFEEFSEADRLAWQVARVSPALGTSDDADGLLGKNRYRIGAEMHLSGWEVDDLSEAALSFLGDTVPGASRSGRDAVDGGKSAGSAPAMEAQAEAAIISLRERPREEADSRRPVRAGRDSKLSARALRTRANAAYEAGREGRHAEAEGEFRAVWEQMAALDELGARHPDTLTARHNMAYEMAKQGRHAEAETHFRAILEELRRAKNVPADHPLALATRHDLAEMLARRGLHDEAKREFEAVCTARSRLRPVNARHPEALWSKAQMLRMRELLSSKTA